MKGTEFVVRNGSHDMTVRAIRNDETIVVVLDGIYQMTLSDKDLVTFIDRLECLTERTNHG